MQFSWHLTSGVNHRLVNFKQGVTVSPVSQQKSCCPRQEQNASQYVVGMTFNVSGMTCTMIPLTKSKSDFQNLT